MAEVRDFLNPSSMLTPGIAGGLTVTMSMPLAVNFELSFKWLALIVSFLLAILVVLSFKEVGSKLLKGLYIILNTLVIFSVSVGAGITVDPPPSTPAISENNQPGNAGTSISETWFITSAHATSADTGTGTGTGTIRSNMITDGNGQDENNSESNEIKKLKAELLRLEDEARREKSLRQKQEQEIQQYNKVKQQHDNRWSW